MNRIFNLLLELLIILGLINRNFDAPSSWGLELQDPATALCEELILFYDEIIFYLILTAVAVLWFLFTIITNRNIIAAKHLEHGSILEIIWTLIPAFILVLIALPSFKLLYLLDEILDPSVTIKAIANQWYWTYEYTDYVDSENFESIAFDSYCIQDADLTEGQLRLLDVDNRLVLPTNTHVRVIITANDVMHAWAVPALAIRTDAIPGRLNAVSFLIKRPGIYYGCCAELCGRNHDSMPIVVEARSVESYSEWILNNEH